MKININDKFIMTKKTRFLEEETVVTVSKIDDNGIVHFVFGEDNNGGSGYMDIYTFNEHFEKVENEIGEEVAKSTAPFVCTDHVANIIEDSDIEVFTVFDKCTVMACRLPNGFVITESSACVSPENYDEEVGLETCYNKIFDKVCELEAYKLQEKMMSGEVVAEDEYCDCTCDGCCATCGDWTN